MTEDEVPEFGAPAMAAAEEETKALELSMTVLEFPINRSKVHSVSCM